MGISRGILSANAHEAAHVLGETFVKNGRPAEMALGLAGAAAEQMRSHRMMPLELPGLGHLKAALHRLVRLHLISHDHSFFCARRPDAPADGKRGIIAIDGDGVYCIAAVIQPAARLPQTHAVIVLYFP